MDHYTLMCSKLEPLQIKASLNPGNWWYHPHYGNGLAIQYWPCLHCDCEVEKAFWFDGYGIKLLEDLQSPMIWLPTLDQLVGMMPKPAFWTIKAYSFMDIQQDLPDKVQSYTFYLGEETFQCRKTYHHRDLKIAILQALAWSKWGKEWDEERKEWGDETQRPSS